MTRMSLSTWRVGMTVLLTSFALSVSVDGLVALGNEPAQGPSGIAHGMRSARHRFFHAKGGISILYRVDVKDDPKNPHFPWPRGLDGSVNIKWPMIRCRLEGAFAGFQVYKRGRYVTETRNHIREANYDFQNRISVARDGTVLGQVANYRHGFSTDALPLLFQSFCEVNQSYVPGEEQKTDYWLPDAILQNPYIVIGEESISEVPCLLIERAGVDRIWVATEKGYVVCRRDYNHGMGKPLRERLLNSKWREVSPEVWIPYQQIKEQYDERDSLTPYQRLTLRVLQVRVGDLSESDTEVVLTRDIAKIEDQISGKIYVPARRGEGGMDPFDLATWEARSGKPDRGGHGHWLVANAFGVGIVVVLAIAIQRIRRDSRLEWATRRDSHI